MVSEIKLNSEVHIQYNDFDKEIPDLITHSYSGDRYITTINIYHPIETETIMKVIDSLTQKKFDEASKIIHLVGSCALQISSHAINIIQKSPSEESLGVANVARNERNLHKFLLNLLAEAYSKT